MGFAHNQQTNRAGRDAFAESIFAGEGKEEVSGWIEGYLWKIEGDDEELVKEGEGEEDVQMEAGDDVSKDEAEAVEEIVEKTERL